MASVIGNGFMEVNLRDEVVSVLCLLQSSKRHLCAWNVLLGVLEIFKLSIVSEKVVADSLSKQHTRVSSFHVIPLDLFASV